MAIAALATERLTLVSLLGDERSPIVSRLLQGRGFRDVRHIAIHAQTTAQRTMTASRIDAAITEADRAVLLVAQGTGCLAAAWWARLSPRSYVARVAGALLIAPDGNPTGADGFASPRSALPFPSVVIGADDASQRLAGEWGSRLIDGPLPIDQRETSGRFQSMIARFTNAIVESDVRAAERLIAAIGDR
jgi:predicted alpha/beta hydrolase family esterase